MLNTAGSVRSNLCLGALVLTGILHSNISRAEAPIPGTAEAEQPRSGRAFLPVPSSTLSFSAVLENGLSLRDINLKDINAGEGKLGHNYVSSGIVAHPLGELLGLGFAGEWDIWEGSSSQQPLIRQNDKCTFLAKFSLNLPIFRKGANSVGLAALADFPIYSPFVRVTDTIEVQGIGPRAGLGAWYQLIDPNKKGFGLRFNGGMAWQDLRVYEVDSKGNQNRKDDTTVSFVYFGLAIVYDTNKQLP